MATITSVEAGYFSGPFIPDRYYYDCRPTDQLFDILEFEPIAGKEIQLNTVSAGTTGLSAYAAAVADGGSLNGTIPSIATRTHALKRIAAEMPVDSALLSKYGSQNDLLGALIQLKVNAVRDEYKRLLIDGDSGANPEEFDGLKVLATSFSNTMGADANDPNAGTVLKGEIEELIAFLNPRKSGWNAYLVMHAKAYMHLLKNNYTDTEYFNHPVLGTVPSIAGVPIVLDNFISLAETKGTSGTATSIYAVMVGKETGLCGIYAAADEGQPIQVRGPVVKDGTDTQWYHVAWNAGLAIYNSCAVARMDGVEWGN